MRHPNLLLGILSSTFFRFVLFAVSVGATSGLLTQPCFAQTSVFAGVVIIDQRELPLANAEIQLPALRMTTRSDSSGRFKIEKIPAGKHSIVVRLIGFEQISTEVEFKAGSTVDVDLVMRPAATTLSAVDVRANATSTGPWAIKLRDFDERRSSGIGKFLTADYFESKAGRPVSSFIQEKLSGIRILQQNGRRWIASTRGCGKECPKADTTVYLERMPPACYLQIVVNGVVRFNSSPGQPPFDIDELNGGDIIGFELYTAATTPLQYRNSGKNTSCGTAIIWTK